MYNLEKEIDDLEDKITSLKAIIKKLQLKNEELEQKLTLQGVVASLLCVDRGDVLNLTIGDKYELIEEGDDYYMVSNDLSEEQKYQKKRFKKL